MGFDEGRIVFNSDNGIYYSGQTVFGTLIFDQEKTKTFRGIYVKFKGFCKVHWRTSHTRTVNGRTETYYVDHNSHEEYINVRSYLIGSDSGDQTIQPGHYEYPFKFVIPSQCPASFEGTYGHIRYEVKAVVDRAFKMDQEKKAIVRLIAPLDLNAMPGVKDPVQIQFNKTYYCCCTSSGKMLAVVKLPMGGYSPGQTMPIEVSCNNDSSVTIDSITFTLKKDTKFHAQGTRSETADMAQLELGEVRPRTSRSFAAELAVPNVDAPNLINCQYIDVDYRIKVTLSPDGCHRDSSEARKIVIGIIPLHGTAGYPPNPADQMTQLNVPGVNQPFPSPYPGANAPYPNQPPYSDYNVPPPNISPYPGPQVTPYPGSNPQYPDGSPYPPTHPAYPPSYDESVSGKGSYTGSPAVAPYPTSNSPYQSKSPETKSPYPTSSNPVTNAPYPTSNSENPASNSPFSSSNPPYPASNSPYPAPTPPNVASNSPYPASNPPYPASNSPYPASNSPYPASNSPYPVSNSAYPASNSPHLPSNSPYPASNSPHPASNSPASNAPYPTSPSPYPPAVGPVGDGKFASPGASSTGMRTGTFRFIAQGRPNQLTTSAPPLPAGTQVPYPNSPSNPFAAATAPEGNSPDDDEKK